MTVSNTTSVAQFNGDGVARAFPFTFRIFKTTDLVVVRRSVSGTSTALTLNTDYTVSGAGSLNGGTVTTTSALAAGELLTVARVLTVQQLTDLRNQGDYFAEIHEDVFDYLTMLIQQIAEGDSRALKHPRDEENYQAEGRRIEDVEDPVAPQDAATRAWSERFIAGILQTGQGPINNAANVIFSGADGSIRTVQDLASKTNPALGAALVGYAGRSLADKLKDIPSVDDYAGANDSYRIQAAIADLPANGGSILFRARTFSFSDLVIDRPLRILGMGGFEGGTIFSNPTPDKPFFSANGIGAFIADGFKMTSSVTRTANPYLSLKNISRCSLERFFMEKYFIGIDVDGGSEVFIDKFAMFNGVSAPNAGAIRLGENNYTGSISIDNGYIKNEDLTKQAAFGIRARFVDVLNLGAGLTIIGHGDDLHVCPKSGQTASLIDSRGTVYDTAVNGVNITPEAGGKVIRADFLSAWAGENTQNGVIIDGRAGLVSGIRFVGGDIIHNSGAGVNVMGANATDIRFDDMQAGANPIGFRLTSGCQVFINDATIGAYGDASANAVGVASDGTCSGRITRTEFDGNTTNISGSLGNIQIFDNSGIDNWIPFTPNVTAEQGSITTVSATGRYLRRYQKVDFEITINITSNGTGAAAVIATLPFNARVTAASVGRESGVTGKSLQGFITASAGTIRIANYDGSYPGQNGAILVMTGFYEIG